jgi:hypothetical protein
MNMSDARQFQNMLTVLLKLLLMNFDVASIEALERTGQSLDLFNTAQVSKILRTESGSRSAYNNLMDCLKWPISSPDYTIQRILYHDGKTSTHLEVGSTLDILAHMGTNHEDEEAWSSFSSVPCFIMKVLAQRASKKVVRLGASAQASCS